jgi:hypothetical protein
MKVALQIEILQNIRASASYMLGVARQEFALVRDISSEMRSRNLLLSRPF